MDGSKLDQGRTHFCRVAQLFDVFGLYLWIALGAIPTDGMAPTNFSSDLFLDPFCRPRRFPHRDAAHPSFFGLEDSQELRSGGTVPIAFDNEIRDRVRSAINIVDLIGSYLELRRQGRSFVARCPFHDDRHPSMQINPDRQSWKCWVCDVGGDVFSWMMQKEGVTFPEALQMLADRAGIELEPQKAQASRDKALEKRDLYQVMQWATAQYHECFLESPEASGAREYVSDRGLSMANALQFQMGYAPDSWTWLLDRGAKASISLDLLESVGLLARSERGTRFDRFRGRVLFPINDPSGRPIAVGGRVLPGAPSDTAKYINCTETRLYEKNRTLYALDQARQAMSRSRQAIVMEGYTDVMMAFQHGIQNAVACCGTALGENHISLLRRYCDSVVLVLDGDEAGQRRTAEILELFLTAQLDLRILTLPDGLDPCDYLLRYGGEALRALIDQSIDALEHKIRTVCQGFDPLLDTHRAVAALEDILGSLARVPQKSFAAKNSNSLRQEQIIVRLSRQFGLDPLDIRRRLDSVRSQSQKMEQMRRAPASPSSMERTSEHDLPSIPWTVDHEVNSHASDGNSGSDSDVSEWADFNYREMQPTECELLEILVAQPELVSVAIERFPVSQLESRTARAVYQLYIDLEQEGHTLDFSSVLSATDDPILKSVLVSLDSHSSRKAGKAIMTPEQRFHSLCARESTHEEDALKSQQIRRLENKELDEQSQLDLLASLLQQAKTRHGIIPTSD